MIINGEGFKANIQLEESNDKTNHIRRYTKISNKFKILEALILELCSLYLIKLQ